MSNCSAKVFKQLLAIVFFMSAQTCFSQFSEQPVLSTETQKGTTIDIFSELSPLDINKIHSWLIRLTDSQGNPLGNAEIEVIGGMPEHDHGLPTQPQITGEIEAGSYVLEGVRFHMPGKWRLDIRLNHNLTTETVVIEFQL